MLAFRHEMCRIVYKHKSIAGSMALIMGVTRLTPGIKSNTLQIRNLSTMKELDHKVGRDRTHHLSDV